LRILIYTLEIRDDSGRTANIVRVLVQEKNRLEQIILTVSESFLFTSKIELSEEVENQDESAAESENSDTAINLDDSANSHELKQQNKIVCVDQDLVKIAETLKKTERVLVLVDVEISINCSIPVSRPFITNRHISKNVLEFSVFKESTQDQSRTIRHQYT